MPVSTPKLSQREPISYPISCKDGPGRVPLFKTLAYTHELFSLGLGARSASSNILNQAHQNEVLLVLYFLFSFISRYACGDTPLIFLNQRVKLLGSVNPSK